MRTGRLPRLDIAAVCGWLGLIVGTHVWGRNTHGIKLNAPPIFGEIDPAFSWFALISIAAAIAIVAFLPSLLDTLTWRRLVLAAVVASIVWAVALAVSDGGHGLLGALGDLEEEYTGAVHFVHSPHSFLSHFVANIREYPEHVQGHPPGMVMVLWVMSKIGLGGLGAAAALMIATGASAVAAALIAAREVAGEEIARRAAPIMAIAPAAVWIATSADAFFMGVSAWAMTLLILATGRTDRRGDWYALGAGLLFGMTIFLSYGLVLVGAVSAGVVVARRRVRPLVFVAAGTVAVVLAFGAEGFWWWRGLRATVDAYYRIDPRIGNTVFFMVSNIAAFALALGPAAAAGLARLRDARTWLLVGGGMAAALLADLSGLSKGETERIWLPFGIWVLLAASALSPTMRARRGWLAAQVTVGLLIQIIVQTPW
ncbi:MAG: glycosyltransferase family 39 protein [Actinomycetota bacterium]